MTVVDESLQPLNEATGSWVEAHVILPATLIDEKFNVVQQEESSSASSSGAAAPKPVYRDVLFAYLFIAHLAVFAIVGISYGGCSTTSTAGGGQSTTDQFNYSDGNSGGTAMMTAILGTSTAIAFAVTYFITALFLPKFPRLAIKASLYGNIIMFSVLGLLIFISHPNLWTFLFLLFFSGVNLWYLFSVQRFIPFASTNLKLATNAISTNFGIYFIAFAAGLIGILWMGFWTYTATGLGIFSDVQIAVSQTAAESNYYDYYGPGLTDAILGLKGFALLLSLYWTINVLANIVQTTTAGVTGTWCFDKTTASSCCSSAVSQSLFRTCTYSFGSVCFGSLLTALVTTLRVLAQWARDNSRNRDRENNAAVLLYCILACILSFIEDILEYFNQWAYIFVGIWGLDYLESGKRVMELFAARGCTAIISDGLTNYVLANVAFFTSVVCGIYAFILGGDGGTFL